MELEALVVFEAMFSKVPQSLPASHRTLLQKPAQLFSPTRPRISSRLPDFHILCFAAERFSSSILCSLIYSMSSEALYQMATGAAAYHSLVLVPGASQQGQTVLSTLFAKQLNPPSPQTWTSCVTKRHRSMANETLRDFVLDSRYNEVY